MNNKQTNRIFSKIELITKKIYSLYDYLCQLEIDGKQHCNQYKKTLLKLESTLNYEKQLYEESNINPDNVYALLHDYYNDLNVSIGEEKENIIFDNDHENNCLSRIIYKTINKNIEDIEVAINEIFTKDDYINFLSFLQEQIENPINIKIVPELIVLKYRTCFLIPDIEEETIKYKFNIPAIKFFNSYLISPKNKIDIDDYYNNRYIYHVLEFEKIINIFLDLDSNNTDEEEKKYILCAISCFINSLTIQANNEEIIEFKNILIEITNECKLEGLYPLYKESLMQINEFLQNKPKRKIISFVL